MDTSGLSTWEVFDPGVDEARVTFLKVRVLEHREPRRAEPEGDPWADIPEIPFGYNAARAKQASA